MSINKTLRFFTHNKIENFNLKATLLGICFFLFSCKPNLNTAEVPLVKFDNVIHKELPASKYIDSTKFIALQTPENIIVSGNLKLKISNKHFLVNDMSTNKCLLYQTDGKWLSQIGSEGKGPEEYLELTDCAVDEEEGIVLVLDRPGNKILLFELNGQFIKTIKLDHWVNSITTLGDHKILIFTSPYEQEGKSDQNFPNILVIDYEGNKLNTHHLTVPYAINMEGYFGANIYRYEDKLCVFPSTAINTVYYFNENFSLQPYYSFTYEGMPDKYAADFDFKKYKTEFKASGISLLFKAPTEFKHVSLIQDAVWNLTRAALLYDKQENKTYNITPATATEYGLLDDLDGGPKIWDLIHINESKAAQIIPYSKLFKVQYSKAASNESVTSEKLKNFINNHLDKDYIFIRLVYFKN